MEQIKFLVDRIEAPSAQGMLHGTAAKAIDVILDLTKDRLNAQLGGIIGDIAAAVSTANLGGGPMEVGEVSFSLNIGTNGEISIVSLVSGNVTTSSGIQITLRPRSR